MKILITGISGFVGTNLVQFINNRHEVVGIDIYSSPKLGNIRIFNWEDLEKKPSYFSEIDVFIHLAGKAHDVKQTSAPEDYFNINTKLTQTIFDFFLTSSAKKFIFFSSVKAAADFVPEGVLTEEVIPNPKGPYGESKIEAEKYILSKLPLDKHVYILRPSMIHGPGNKGNLNLLYDIVKKGIPWPLGAFENHRSFTSIDNISYVVEQLLQVDIISGIYHVSDDQPISTNELIEIICRVMNKKVNIWKVNPFFIKVLAGIGTLLHLPLNKERLIKLTENYLVSNSKIKSALGISRLPVTAKDGLLKTIQSFEDHKN